MFDATSWTARITQQKLIMAKFGGVHYKQG